MSKHQATKRKIEEENRGFNQEWTFKYFMFVNSAGKIVCLICRESVGVAKDFNCKRHYKAKYAAAFDNLNSGVPRGAEGASCPGGTSEGAALSEEMVKFTLK